MFTISLYFILVFLSDVHFSFSGVLFEVKTKDHEDNCGLFPPCQQLGEGSWQILENCHFYVECRRQPDGSYIQHNMECPGDLWFDEVKKQYSNKSYLDIYRNMEIVLSQRIPMNVEGIKMICFVSNVQDTTCSPRGLATTTMREHLDVTG